MRAFSRIVLTLGLVVLLAAPALAQRQQGQRGAGGGQGGIGSLLTNESVQKELKIEKEQADKVKEAVTKVTDKYKDDLAKVRDLPMEEQRAKRTELNKSITEETLKSVEEILKPEQIKRLKQIELQTLAVRAFTRPDVVAGLKLTDDQKEKIKTITTEYTKEMADLRPMRGAGGNGGGNGNGGGANRAANAEKITALNKATEEKIQGVLTDEQKKTWKDMTGEAFTVVRPQGNRRPGGNPPPPPAV